MQQLVTLEGLARLEGPLHLAIGVFDGVHLGHQAVFQSAKDQALKNGGQAVVATFDPHPAEVLAPDKAPKRISSLAQMSGWCRGLGMDAVLAMPFDREMAAQPAEAFVEALNASGNLASIHVGVDWAFGKGRRGNVELLRRLGQEQKFSVTGVEPVLSEEVRVSSSAIRIAIHGGDLDQVQRLLGRHFSLHGPVVTGDQLGRQLGFPTANVAFETAALPPHGVYVVRVPSLDHHPGVANLGVRPSVSGDLALRFEVHLIDWEGDLYGEMIEVELLDHLRPEKRFAGLPELQAQIALDLEASRQWHEGH